MRNSSNDVYRSEFWLIITEKVFVNLRRLYQKLFLLIWLRKHKRELGFLTPNGLRGEAVESILEYRLLWIGGLAKVLFWCRVFFFQLFLPFGIPAKLPAKLPQVWVSYKPSVSREFPMWPQGCAKNLLLEFAEKNYRENTAFCFLGRFSFSRYVFLYLTPSCQLFEPCCSEKAFTKHRLVFTDFWGAKKFFLI